MAAAITKDKLAEEARNQGNKIADDAQSMAHKATDRAKEVGSSISDQAQNLAHKATDHAKEAGSMIADKAEAATGAIGAGMESVGHAVRDYTPKSLHQAGDVIADKLESGGRYLEEKGMSGIGDDLTELIRANPVPALLVGIGFGFVLARLLRS